MKQAVIDALKNHPAVAALIVTNLVYLAVIVWVWYDQVRYFTDHCWPHN